MKKIKKITTDLNPAVIVASVLVTTTGMGTIKIASIALKAVVTMLVRL